MSTARSVRRGEPGYESARRSLSASAYQPAVHPSAIVRATGTQDVVAVIEHARRTGSRVTTRSGGHGLSWTHLHDNAVTVDLRDLKGFTVNRERHTAWVGPGLTTVDAARLLDESAHSFPIGHAPAVGLGGYLLAGGNGWNCRVWGHACERVLAADVVTADAAVVRVDRRTRPGLFRALRGGGPAFPGVVTALELALVPGRRSISRHVATYLGEEACPLGEALDDILPRLAPVVEVTVFVRPPDPDQGTGPTIMVAATCFAGDESEVADLLRPLGALGIPAQSASTTTTGRSLHGLVAGLPDHASDAMISHQAWSTAGFASLLGPLVEAVMAAPSAMSSVLLTSASRRLDLATPDQAVYMPFGTMSVATYAHWRPPAGGPDENRRWARSTLTGLSDLCAGHYVGEVDLTGPRSWTTGSYTPEAWAHLTSTRDALDPDHLFCSILDHPNPPGGAL